MISYSVICLAGYGEKCYLKKKLSEQCIGLKEESLVLFSRKKLILCSKPEESKLLPFKPYSR